jgi:hypothetical protein
MPNYEGSRDFHQKNRANLSLRAQLGTISATIELAGGPDRVQLVNTTTLGTIRVRVVSSILSFWLRALMNDDNV